MSEFIHVEPVIYWCHKILPLVYDDSLSYMELLNKVVYKLNEVVNNNNELPAYIAEQIKNYINSGEISKVVQDILANYSLNVKFPPEGITPAVGDGTADDTAAFQGCLDYAHAHGGMMVFVPAGKYLCGNLTMYSGCSIKGDGRYDTTIVMRGGVTNPFIGGELDAVQIADIGIDGNADIQVNNVDVFNVKLSNALMTNLFITDGYTLLKIQENGGDIQIDNVVFDKAVVRAVDLIKGVSSRVQMRQVVCRDVSKLNGESAMRIGTDGGYYTEITSIANAPIGIEVSGNNNYVEAIIENAVDSCKNTGENNNIKIIGQEENYSITGNYDCRVHGNRGIHVDGVDSVNVGGQNVVVNGDSSFRSTGQRTEQYDASRTETVGVKKTTTAGSIVENVEGEKTVNSQSLFLNTANPIKYKKPTRLNRAFNIVPMLDTDNKPYNLLVEGENATAIGAYLTPEMFGAVGDGVADDTAAIKECLATAVTNISGVVMDKTYLVTDTITIDGSVLKHIACNGLIKSSFTDKPCVVIENASFGFYRIKVEGSTANGGYNFTGHTDYSFGNLPNVGILIKNSRFNGFELAADKYEIGIQCYADVWWEGNNTRIMWAVDCAVDVDLWCEGQGYVNQNTFTDGDIADRTTNANRGNCIGIRLHGETNTINNNLFINTSFQHRGLPLYMENAQDNAFENVRMESKPRDGAFYKVSGLAQNNRIGTLSGSINNPTSGANRNFCYPNEAINNINFRTVFDWVFDRKKCVGVLGDSRIQIYTDGIEYLNYITGNLNAAPPELINKTSVPENGLESAYQTMLGKLIKLNGTAQLTVTLKGDTDAMLGCVCFDANMSPIAANVDDSGVNVSQAGWRVFSGYCVATGAANPNRTFTIYFNNPSIKYVFIGCANGSGIYGMTVFAPYSFYNEKPAVPINVANDYQNVDISDITKYTGALYKGLYIKSVACTTGSDTKGNYIIKGWLCTDATTPTWVEDKIYTT